MIYTVFLYVCFSANPCTLNKAQYTYEGFFTNSTQAKTPCEDWLLTQLEFGTQITHDHDELTIHFECRRKQLEDIDGQIKRSPSR